MEWDKIQQDEIRCDMICDIIWYDMMKRYDMYGMIWYGMVWPDMTWQTIQYSIMWCNVCMYVCEYVSMYVYKYVLNTLVCVCTCLSLFPYI